MVDGSTPSPNPRSAPGLRPLRYPLAGAALILLLLVLLWPPARPTGAVFSDTAVVSSGPLTAGSPAPVGTPSCSAGLASVTFTWPAQSYRTYVVRVVNRANGAVVLAETPVTANSYTVGASLLAGGQLRFDVAAVVTGSTWRSSFSSTTFSQSVAGLVFTCG